MENPIFKKDKHVRVRSPKLMLLVLFYNLGITLLMSIAYLLIYKNSTHEITAKYQDTLFLYIVVSIFQAILLIMIIPAFTASAISGEKERQTFDILITSKIKPKTIIFGKLASSISVMLLLLISSLPIISMVFSIGGVKIKDVIIYIIVCTFEAFFIGSIGIFFSTISKTTTKAVVATYITLFVLIIGNIALLEILHMLISKQLPEELYTESTQIVADLKNLVCICLINPLVTIAKLLFDQTGNTSVFLKYEDEIGICNTVIRTYWIPLSICIQTLIGGILIGISIKNVGKIQK